MFKSLSSRIVGAFDTLSKAGHVTEEDICVTLNEVRAALLDADVALSVVREFLGRVKSKAVGNPVLKSISPYQMVIKIVHDELVDMLEGDHKISSELKVDSAPAPVVLAGLQGSGKTTTTSKLARYLKEKRGKKVLVTSLDVYRPAAIEQLRVLANEIDVAFFPAEEQQTPVQIAMGAMSHAKTVGYDVVLLDTAGRLHIDQGMMDELQEVVKATNPHEILLVADSLSGQVAARVAQEFNAYTPLTGIILTRMDGDSRGGAALSMRKVTGKPIKFIGVGEKTDALEVFHPDRVARRILDMGDIVSLVEKASELMEQETAERQAKRMIRGHFDFNDYALYLQQMEQMGGIAGIMEMMPGTQKFAEKNSDSLDESGTDNFIKKQTALIQAMTKKERTMAIPLNGSRKKRIALGAGSDVQNVNNLVKMHRQIGDMVKKISKLNPASLLMNGIKKKPTGQGAIPDLNSLKGFAGGEKAAKAMKNSPNFNVQNFLNSKKQWPL